VAFYELIVTKLWGSEAFCLDIKKASLEAQRVVLGIGD